MGRLQDLRDQALSELHGSQQKQEGIRDQLRFVEKAVQGIEWGRMKPQIFLIDARRWEITFELMNAHTSGGWDDEVHSVLEAEFPQWRDFYECTEHRGCAGRNLPKDFANSVVIWGVARSDFIVRWHEEGWMFEEYQEGSRKDLVKKVVSGPFKSLDLVRDQLQDRRDAFKRKKKKRSRKKSS